MATPEQFNPMGFGQAFVTPGGASPQYGFTNTYKPSPQAEALGRVIEILQDPRNSWMGLGGIRGLGRLRGRLFQDTREMGGFSVPTSQMRRDLGIARENTFKWQPPTGEPALRHEYLGTVDALNAGASQPDLMAIANPALQALLEKTKMGQTALRSEMQREMGGQVPTPDMISRLFGQQ